MKNIPIYQWTQRFKAPDVEETYIKFRARDCLEEIQNLQSISIIYIYILLFIEQLIDPNADGLSTCRLALLPYLLLALLFRVLIRKYLGKGKWGLGAPKEDIDDNQNDIFVHKLVVGLSGMSIYLLAPILGVLGAPWIMCVLSASTIPLGQLLIVTHMCKSYLIPIPCSLISLALFSLTIYTRATSYDFSILNCWILCSVASTSWIGYHIEHAYRASFYTSTGLKQKKMKFKEFINMIPEPMVQLNSGGAVLAHNSAMNILLLENRIASFSKFSELVQEKKRGKLGRTLEEGIQERLNEAPRIPRGSQRWLNDGISGGLNSNNNVKFSEYTSDYVFQYRSSVPEFNSAEDISDLCNSPPNEEEVELEVKFCGTKGAKTIGERGNLLVILKVKDKLKQLQEEKMANRYKNTIIRTISHDLRTPLNGIVGLLSELDSKRDHSEFSNILNIIKMSANILAYKLNDMLDYSLLESGEFCIESTKLNVIKLVKEIFNICKVQAKLSGITQLLIIPTDLPENIVTDERRLKQVLLHLILNAIKFAPNGEVKIILKEFVDSIRFEIHDSGMGMDASEQKRLFKCLSDKPSKGRSSIKDITGVGLSLIITRKICRKLGSELFFTSYKGKGSIFYFNLPDIGDGRCPKSEEKSRRPTDSIGGRVASTHRSPSLASPLFTKIRHFTNPSLVRSSSGDGIRVAGYGDETEYRELEESKQVLLLPTLDDLGEGEIVCEEESAIQSLAAYTTNTILPIFPLDFSRRRVKNESSNIYRSLESKRGLVVDDNAVNRLVLRNMLRGQCMRYIEEAINGEDAVNQVVLRHKENQPFDVIFMDLNMPVMDGIEATIKLRKEMEMGRLGWTPIVAVTAYDSDQVKTKCKKVGMKGYIVKPVRLDQLRAIIIQLFGH